MTQQTNMIYSDAIRTILANDDGLCFIRSNACNLDLPWSNIVDLADVVTRPEVLAELRNRKITTKSVFALRINLSGERRAPSMAREIAIPVAARKAIESAIADYESRKTEIASRKTRATKEAQILIANTIRINLSSRGWGDYSNVEWTGDQRRSDAEILAECKHLLATGHDVDEPEQSDEQILAKIAGARARKADAPRREKEAEEYYNRDMGAGYCYSCETHCYGDCGNYQPKRTSLIAARDARQVADEANYGIND